MARRPSRREGLELRSRGVPVAATATNFTLRCLEYILSPTLLLACIFVVSFTTQIMEGISAAYAVAGSEIGAAERASAAIAVPLAGPSSTPAGENSMTSPLVSWREAPEGEDAAPPKMSLASNSTGSTLTGTNARADMLPVDTDWVESKLSSTRGPSELLSAGGREAGGAVSYDREMADASTRAPSSKHGASLQNTPSQSKNISLNELEGKSYKNAYLRPQSDFPKAPEERTGARKPTKILTVHASTLERPRGAKAGIGKVGEFMGSHLEDGTSMVRGQNVTRLSYALYKIVRLFNLKKLIDFPSGAHVEWMPEMVTRFEYDIPGFRYEGLDTTEERLASAKRAGESYGSAEFKVADPETVIPVDGGDMILVWNELDGQRSDPRSPEYAAYILRVLKAARKANIAYITFGQYPRLRGVAPIFSKGRWRFIGTSKEEVSDWIAPYRRFFTRLHN
jgi:hypothetical protein